ncbi:MAG: SRPBCC family protein [Thermoleophilia bacterium]|jgi:uncharacterized protein YndB with AHSA1/START domain|nr:SRPBCC family protein [Thermoleophilia bacterium]
MTDFRRTILVPCDRATAFALVGDFALAQEWDPGILRSERQGATEGLGARYDVIAAFRGREVPFTYEVTDWVPGERIVLRGEGQKAWAEDTITFADAEGGGTSLTYAARLGMKGVLKLAGPFLGGTFQTLGTEALDGLERWLTSRCAGGG